MGRATFASLRNMRVHIGSVTDGFQHFLLCIIYSGNYKKMSLVIFMSEYYDHAILINDLDVASGEFRNN